MVRRNWIVAIVLALAACSAAKAQEGGSVFNFLNIPTSAHAVGLGGKNISLTDDDIALTFQNPALMANISDKTIGLNFITYMQGVKAGSAAFCKAHKERGTWGVQALFQGYGNITETTMDGDIIGSSGTLDMCLSGGYSYELSEHWVGGATGKFIYSKYAGFSSVALAVDLGVNYYNENLNLSWSTVVRNLGGQVKRFGNEGNRLPINLETGITWGLGHAPVQIHLTMVDLTAWRQSDYYSVNGGPSASRIFFNHFVIGADVRPTKYLYACLGYSFRRASEMTAAGSSHAAGLSFGAGVNLKKFKFGFAYAKYHVSMPTFAFSLGYSL